MQRGLRPNYRNFHQLASLRVEMLARQSERHADADFRRKLGLGILHCRIIGMVGSQGPLSLRALCIGHFEKTYASRLVAQLTALGLLEKSPDASDQRSFDIALTKTGRRAYDRIYRIAQQRNENWLAALSPEQRKTFFECLDILALASKKLTAGSRPSPGSSRRARGDARKRPASDVEQDIKRSEVTSKRSKVESSTARGTRR